MLPARNRPFRDFDMTEPTSFMNCSLHRCPANTCASGNLEEVEEIAESGPMRLFLCDLALERVRLAFAKIDAFAPINGLIAGSPSKPAPPDMPGQPDAESIGIRSSPLLDATAVSPAPSRSGFVACGLSGGAPPKPPSVLARSRKGVRASGRRRIRPPGSRRGRSRDW